MADRGRGRSGGRNAVTTDDLSQQFQQLVSALTEKAMSGASGKVGGLTDKLTGLAEGGSAAGRTAGKAGKEMAEGKSPVKSALSGGFEGIKSKVGEMFGGGSGGEGGKKMKVTNIIEEIDVGAPVSVVYDQWTQFQEFSHFMKKVEDVDQKDDEKLTFKAQVLWSHRTWEATIVEQVPDQRIVWKSKGEKGHVDGAVTFHELGPELTRVLVVLEYHPQGLFERTGNLWRAQGRRVRLELKHFRRHVMMNSVLHPDDVDGWRGEIHDGEVTEGPDEAQDEADDETDETDETDENDENDELEDEADEEYEDEDEDEEDEEYEDEGDEETDEYEDDEEEDYADEEAEPEDEDEEEPAPQRSRARSGRR